jgi:hypothetical protein
VSETQTIVEKSVCYEELCLAPVTAQADLYPTLAEELRAVEKILADLVEEGFVEVIGERYGYPLYDLTEAGRTYADSLSGEAPSTLAGP